MDVTKKRPAPDIVGLKMELSGGILENDDKRLLRIVKSNSNYMNKRCEVANFAERGFNKILKTFKSNFVKVIREC